MFILLFFLFSLLKGIYNTCAKYKQVNKQANVARIHCVGFFGIFSTSIKKVLLDTQRKEYNTKRSRTPTKYDDSQNNTYTTPTATITNHKSLPSIIRSTTKF